MNLQQAAQKLVNKHGSQNAAGRACQITGQYVHMMVHGKVKTVSKHVMRRMGIRLIPATFEFTKH